jgi:uncharacterized phage-associated protein
LEHREKYPCIFPYQPYSIIPCTSWSAYVVPELYQRHQGHYQVDQSIFPAETIKELSELQKESIDAVLKYYGDKSSQWLSDLTHMEEPWKQARKRANLRDNERGSEEITLESMAEYYNSIVTTEQ